MVVWPRTPPGVVVADTSAGAVVATGLVKSQVDATKVSSSSVTAPLRANARPCTVTFVVTLIEVRAKMLPTKLEPVPRVAELPTCQKTLHSCAPLINRCQLTRVRTQPLLGVFELLVLRLNFFALHLQLFVLGLQFLQDLSEFFLAFEGMYAGFKERAVQVQQVLRSHDAGFILVAGPSALTLDEALYFHRRLVERKMPFVGFIVNRLHPATAGAAGRGLAPDIDDDLGDRLVEVFKDYSRLSGAEMKNVARLEDETGTAPVLVPELEGDVHDLDGLHEVGELLFGDAARPARRGRTRARAVAAAAGRGAAR